MKTTIETKYIIICHNGREITKDSLIQAKEVNEFLQEAFPEQPCYIIERQVESNEIEKGDKVYWLQNGKPNTSRIDIVTGVIKNAWGDIQYKTKEINGNRQGIAYKSYLALAE